MGNEWLSYDGDKIVEFDLVKQVQAIGWGLAMILFGVIVLAFDTRTIIPRRSGFNLRDRIAGLEQRYFLVVLNGFLLYAALICLLDATPPQLTPSDLTQPN